MHSCKSTESDMLTLWPWTFALSFRIIVDDGILVLHISIKLVCPAFFFFRILCFFAWGLR